MTSGLEYTNYNNNGAETPFSNFSGVGDGSVHSNQSLAASMATTLIMCSQNGSVVGGGGGRCDNRSMEELLMMRLGPRYKSTTEAAMLTLVYVLIFVTGVVGNVCTCTVIIRNSYMHTATNYYLFTLAISDVLTLILGQSFYIFNRYIIYVLKPQMFYYSIALV